MSERTVLYAEDNADDALFMQMAFSRAGLKQKMLWVNNGEEAILYLDGQGQYADRQKHPLPSLLLLDLKMPIKSGFEVLDWLRAHPELKNLKVVVVTSSGQQSDRDRLQEMGVVDYIIKPSAPSQLAEVVRKGAERWF